MEHESVMKPGEYMKYKLLPVVTVMLCCAAVSVEAQEGRRYVKPDPHILKERLSHEEYYVTQQKGTEAPFKNRYWDHHAPGIYVDIVTGEPLFSSIDKYDSGTGWPSFSKPIKTESLIQKADRQLLMERTEVRSAGGDSHLGHVFDDGPGPDGKRFCINSSALRFVPVENLAAEGYGEYVSLFRSVNPG